MRLVEYCGAVTLLALSIASTAGAMGDAEAGKVKAYTCKGCHSVDGYQSVYPSFHVPHIGGQHAAYVAAALKAYSSGSRRHPSMLSNAATMSDQDMQDIAAYVARFRGMGLDLAVTGDAAAGRRKSESCGSCHGEDGNGLDENFPRLAGQYESFLIRALKEYRSGERKNAIMKGMAEGLSDEDIKDIAAFYASQKKGLTIIPE